MAARAQVDRSTAADRILVEKETEREVPAASMAALTRSRRPPTTARVARAAHPGAPVAREAKEVHPGVPSTMALTILRPDALTKHQNPLPTSPQTSSLQAL